MGVARYSRKYTGCISFSISFSEAVNAVTGSSPAQLPLVISRQNTCEEYTVQLETILDTYSKVHYFMLILILYSTVQCSILMKIFHGIILLAMVVPLKKVEHDDLP